MSTSPSGPTRTPQTSTSGPTFSKTALAASTGEEPLLPTTYNEDELRAAVGAKPLPKSKAKKVAVPDLDDLDDDLESSDDGDGDGPKSRKLIVVAATSVVVGLGIAATVFIGRNNSSRLVMSCEAKQVIAQRGRAFPPWGERAMTGDEWRPIEIPADFICMDAEVETVKDLGNLFRTKLVERADALLMAGSGAEIDKAAAMLEQALLHARTDDEDHKIAREDIKQRLGDVGYWRASAKLKEASAALEEAAKQFENAALQRPRYVKDASKWAELIRRLSKELQAGPAGVAKPADVIVPPVAPQPDRPTAPPGVALPVEPAGSATPTEPSPPPAQPPAPDAGVPTGGVLL